MWGTISCDRLTPPQAFLRDLAMKKSGIFTHHCALRVVRLATLRVFSTVAVQHFWVSVSRHMVFLDIIIGEWQRHKIGLLPPQLECSATKPHVELIAMVATVMISVMVFMLMATIRTILMAIKTLSWAGNWLMLISPCLGLLQCRQAIQCTTL